MDFYKFINSKGYGFFKTTADLVIINMLFVLTSVLSLGVLFVPGLFVLSNLTYRMNQTFISPFIDYFGLLKVKTKKYFGLIIGFYIVVVSYFFLGRTAYLLIENDTLLTFTYLSIIIMIGFTIAYLVVFLHLFIYDCYFEDQDKLSMKIRKAALIGRKRPLISLLFAVNLIVYLFISYLLKFLFIVITFSLVLFIMHKIGKVTYENLYLEEEKRRNEEQV